MSPLIAILLPDLRPGGAERMQLRLAEEWLRLGCRVEFVLLAARGELMSLLPPGATVVDIDSRRVRSAPRPLALYLRSRRPDALIAAMWPLTVIAPFAAKLASFSGRVVISEHSILSSAYAGYGRAHRMALRSSMRLGYLLASARIAVSRGVADDLSLLSGLARDRFDTIHNPAASGRRLAGMPVRPPALASIDGPLILSVGTLKKAKRHDLMIEAFSHLPEDLRATLCILGEGQERDTLENKVGALGLSGRVLLPGFSIDPSPWYAHADLFVLSSDHEGFGNVLVEALEHRLPIVSTDCPSGPREILDGGRYGRLVPVGDAEALAEAMETALRTDHDRDALMRRALEFSVERAAGRYLELLVPGWRKPEE